jgi:RNA polymerase sporulation-specific sigma factor
MRKFHAPKKAKGKWTGNGEYGCWGGACNMLPAVWLILGSLLYSLQLSTGSFPKPLSEEEERHYLELAQKGDLDARNVLIERNLRLVAHIMNKG